MNFKRTLTSLFIGSLMLSAVSVSAVVQDPSPMIDVTTNSNEKTITIEGTITPSCDVIVSDYCWRMHNFGGDGPYEVKWGDGSVTCESLPATHSYDQFGTYPVTIKAKNTCGYISEKVLDAKMIENKVNSISLTGTGKNIFWTVDGYSAGGYKIIWSKNENPVFPTREGDQAHYYSDPIINSDLLTGFAGAGDYYVRVCEYKSGECGIYSNQVKVSLTADPNTSAEVKSITLEGTGANISWIVDGNSAGGFKVVWSMNENPVYPSRDGDQYHYFTEPEKRSDTISAFAGAGNYFVRVCEYKNDACGIYSNQIKVVLGNEGDSSVCTTEYDPVCGSKQIQCITTPCDPIEQTYGNKCEMEKAGAVYLRSGKCESGSNDQGETDLEKIEKNAKYLVSNNLDAILGELKQSRNIFQEQAAKTNYLNKLLTSGGSLSANVENSLTNFIAYGVDSNTQRLGAGERTAVLYSYRSAFGKLPESESEITDVIKIANGRWPGKKSVTAETNAKAEFRKIYGRAAIDTNTNDQAALVVMAYGLRQKAENRNLNSEKVAINSFRYIYKRAPSSTEDWNIVQAIAYSGAKR